ncbi:MAG: HAD family phosphatase [Saccharofermentans sp.]|nr:HAD family phosphatase [Saccharofermentans sp.]
MAGYKIQAVIFDLDGTLTDTEKYYQVAWPMAIEHFGYKCEPWMPLELRSLGRPFAPLQFKEWFGEDFDYYKVRDYRKQIVKEMIAKEGIPLKPGAVSILKWLKEQEITVAMATANGYERTSGYLDRIGLREYFDRIICADMVEYGKPAPDIYAYAVSQIGTDPDRTIAVEDSPNGVRSAYKAGLKVVMVPDLTEPDDEISDMLYACVAKLDDIRELILTEGRDI